MKINSILIITLLLLSVLIAGCTPPNLSSTPAPDNTLPATEVSPIGMANPASVFCEEQGGKLEIRNNADGSQYGVCIFADGSECEEWAFFNGDCAPASKPPIALVPSDMLITLERTACYGTCPVYTLSVDATGRVEYDGRGFVAVEGEQISQISSEQVALLLAAFTEAGYFDMEDSYKDWMMTDMPTAITSITLNGKTKRIEHYYGDMHAPEALIKLEAWIDEITDSAQWTQKAGEKPQTSEEEIRTLDGTQWNLSGANITLDFKDGVASGNAGCNDYSSSYQIDGKTLTFGMIASNLEMCADEEVMKQEAVFLESLSSTFAFVLVPDDILILFGEKDALVFTPAQDILLQGHDWTLGGISQGQAIVQNWIDETITIRFEDEKVSGSTGCNRYFGNYEIDGDKLTLGPVSTTRRTCDKDHARREAEFLDALNRVNRYAINRLTLTLFDDNGAKLMVFGLQ